MGPALRTPALRISPCPPTRRPASLRAGPSYGPPKGRRRCARRSEGHGVPEAPAEPRLCDRRLRPSGRAHRVPGEAVRNVGRAAASAGPGRRSGGLDWPSRAEAAEGQLLQPPPSESLCRCPAEEGGVERPHRCLWLVEGGRRRGRVGHSSRQVWDRWKA